jgi:hypothetical protein
MAYYYDHQEEIDEEIQRELQEVEDLREKAGRSPLFQRLRGKGMR